VNFRKFAYVQYVCGNGRCIADIYLLIQNGDVYTAAKLPSEKIAQS